jgi:hypothetical protein
MMNEIPLQSRRLKRQGSKKKKGSDVRTALHAEQARNRQVEEDGGMKAVRCVGRSS